MWVSLVLGIVHYKQIASSTIGLACQRTDTAQWPRAQNIGPNLQPFTSNDDVSIWVKNSRVGRQIRKKNVFNILGHFPRVNIKIHNINGMLLTCITFICSLPSRFTSIGTMSVNRFASWSTEAMSTGFRTVISVGTRCTFYNSICCLCISAIFIKETLKASEMLSFIVPSMLSVVVNKLNLIH